MKLKSLLLCLFALFSISGWGPFFLFSNTHFDSAPVGSKEWVEAETKIITSQASNLEPSVLKLGLTAYLKARKEGMDNKQLLTIVDYSKPSTEKRLWVVDMKRAKVLFNTWVAHGQNSGDTHATSFSNDPESHKTSLGVFTTRETYMGHNGLSLRIKGLEHGVNDNAYSREIVFHGAWYADGSVARERGTLGRSWGCLAVAPSTIKPLVETIKDDTLVVAYYPDRHWLHNSTYVNATLA